MRREQIMTGDQPATGRDVGTGRALPFFALVAAGLVHGLLPQGTFGAQDVVIRAVLTGAAAGVTAFLLLVFPRR
jgi:hypothetical protein